jgi:hypothetical protein
MAAKNNSTQYQIRQNMERLNTLDSLSINPLRLGRKVGIFPEFQTYFIADDSQLKRLI